MGKINDEEDLLKSVRAHVMSTLNAYIALVNTEKTDFSIDEIEAVDANYVFSGELLDLPNHAFVNFAFSGEIQVLTNGNDKASLPSIMIEVAFDNPKKANTYWTSLRYMRALTKSVLSYESTVSEIVDSRVLRLLPMIVTDNRRELVVSGVELSVSIS